MSWLNKKKDRPAAVLLCIDSHPKYKDIKIGEDLYLNHVQNGWYNAEGPCTYESLADINKSDWFHSEEQATEWVKIVMPEMVDKLKPIPYDLNNHINEFAYKVLGPIPEHWKSEKVSMEQIWEECKEMSGEK